MRINKLAGIFCLVLLAGIYKTANCQNPNLSWAAQFGGADNNNTAIAMFECLDAEENVYSVGMFTGTVDLNSGTAVQSATSNGSADIFIQKHDASGNFLWAKTIGNALATYPVSITADLQGNVFVGIKYNGDLDVNPGSGINTVSTTAALGDHSFVIVKLDPTGIYLGNVDITSTMVDLVYTDMAVGSDNNLYLVHTYLYNRISLIKYNAADFSVIWEKEFGNYYVQGNSFASGLTLDASNNIIITGTFSYSVSLDPADHTIESTGSFNSFDFFVSKLNSDGVLLWGHGIGGSGTEENATDVAVDNSGNIAVSGFFNGTMDFNPSAATTNLTSLGGADGFILKMTSAGGLTWVKRFGTPSDDTVINVDFDTNGSAIALVNVPETMDMDPNSGTSNLSVIGLSRAIVKLNTTGNYQWAYQLGLLFSSFQKGDIETGTANSIYLNGSFGSGFDADPGAGSHPLNSANGANAYLLKWSQCTPSTSTLTANACASYTLNNQTYTQSGTYTQVLPNAAATCDSIITLNLTISSQIQPTVSISSNIINVCNGETVIFTASSTGGGTTPTYQWFLDGQNVSSGNTYTTSGLSAGQSVYCVMTSNLACATTNQATSNTIALVCISGSSELFFSEYLEGSSNNKALEIFNPSGAAIDLSPYKVLLYSNGSGIASSTLTLTGSIASGDVLVIANSQAAAEILAVADLTNAVCGFNGDDAVVLEKSGIAIDIIGQVGIDPGTNWPVDVGGATSEYTLVRNPTVVEPTTDWTLGQTQWTIYPANTFSFLGSHSISTVVPDPQVSISASGTTVCPGESLTFYADITDGGSNPQIFWVVDGAVLQEGGLSFTTSSFNNGSEVSCQVTSSPGNVQVISNSIPLFVLSMPNMNVSIQSNTLVATQSGALYQWLDCNNNFTEVPFQSQQSFSPSMSGSYAVEINLNGCISTSTCVSIVISEIAESQASKFAIYPNPTTSILNIESTELMNSLSVYDLCGKCIYTQTGRPSFKQSIDVSTWTSGIYSIAINNGGRMKVVVE